MENSKKRILALDVGGTKIASAIVELEGEGYKIFDYNKNETPKGKEKVINKIIEIAVNYEKNGGFDEIGIAIAGQVDNKKDLVKNAPNIKGFMNVNLKKIIKEKTGKNAEIDNDVKCFAMAEKKYGKGKKYKNVVYITVGTGIGGAIEIGSKLYRGANNTAGEFGHMVIVSGGEKCPCGNLGCWEQYVSGKAIENSYYKISGERKKAKDIAFDSLKNIALDKKIIRESSFCLATGLINIINTINPEIIIIGGSIVKSDEILKLAKKEVEKRVLIPARKTKVEKSSMEDEAFLVGAALL